MIYNETRDILLVYLYYITSEAANIHDTKRKYNVSLKNYTSEAYSYFIYFSRILRHTVG